MNAEKDYIIPLVDGGVMDIDTDETAYGGCPTCDYGSHYVNDIYLKLTKYSFHIDADQMYEHFLSTGILIKLLTKLSRENLTENDFCDRLESMVRELKEKSISDCELSFTKVYKGEN